MLDVSSRALLVWTWILVGIHLVWMGVRYGLGFPIWGDEAFVAVNFYDRSMIDLVQPLEYGQIAPLFWLWLEKLCFDLFGASPWSLRLPAFLAGIASTFLMLRFCLRALPQPSALLGFAIFAASYYPLRHAVELKPYSVDLLFALLMLNLALDIIKHAAEKLPQAGRWTALMVVSLLGVWSSFPSLFISGSLIVYFGCAGLFGKASDFRHRLNFILPSALWAVWLAISAIMMVRIFAGPHAESASWLTEMAMWTPTFPPLAEWWRIPEWLLQSHAGYMSAYPTGGRNYGSSATLLLIVIGIIAVVRSKRRGFLWLLLGPLLFTFVAAAMERYPYGGSVRVSIYMAPAFCLLAGHGLATLFARASAKVQGGVTVFVCLLLTGFAISGVVRDVQKPHKIIADRKSLEFADWMEQTVAADDVVAGFCNTERGYLPDFFHLGGSMARLRFHLTRDFDHPVLWGGSISALALARGGNMPGHFWLVAYTDDNDTGMPFPQQEFDILLQQLNAERGPAEHFEFPFKNAERIDVYRYAPRE
jgi:hypothetical protein